MTTETLLEQDFGQIPALIAAHARLRPAHPALIEGAAQLSFGELDGQMDRVAAALQRDGLSVGDVIAIGAGTSIPYALVFLGGGLCGAALAFVERR
jgi:long-chain acyl-CoA synthetase